MLELGNSSELLPYLFFEAVVAQTAAFFCFQMRKITSLQVQKGNKSRVNVYLDDEFAFGLALDAAMSLRVNQELSPEEIASLRDEDSFFKARDSALRFLGYRARSVVEVRRNLRGKKYEDALIERVIAYLLEAKLLDDVAFATYWVEQRETFKPRGRRALQQELMQKGVSRPVIEEVLDDLDETGSARRAAETRIRRWNHLPYDEFRAKMGGFLQRRGFGYGIVRQVIDEIWQSLDKNEN